MRLLIPESKRSMFPEGGADILKKTLFGQTLKRLFSNRTATVGLIIFLIIFLLALLAPVIAPYSYEEIDLLAIGQGPTAKHLLGCDKLGRDMLTRILYGARYSLGLGISSALLGFVIGVIFGSIAGYFGGYADNIVMRFMDILQALPAALLAIVISATLGPGLVNTIIAMSIGSVPSIARMLRAQIMGIRKSEYLEATVSINCSKFRSIMKYTLPNAISPLIVATTMSMGGNIIGAAGLSFIGLGVQPPTPEWGAMLSEGRNYFRTDPHLILVPGIFIFVTVMAMNLFGDGLRDALDPKLKK